MARLAEKLLESKKFTSSSKQAMCIKCHTMIDIIGLSCDLLTLMPFNHKKHLFPQSV